MLEINLKGWKSVAAGLFVSSAIVGSVYFASSITAERKFDEGFDYHKIIYPPMEERLNRERLEDYWRMLEEERPQEIAERFPTVIEEA
tara:strand:- start:1831 stop:2094 length:264 start_codon:yes stop_codon:yes gene_type:complete